MILLDPRRRTRWKLGLVVALTAATTAISAQESQTTEMAPAELVRVTVANEVTAANHPDLHHMFRSRRQTPKGAQTRVYVETNQALAGMLIAMRTSLLTYEKTNHRLESNRRTMNVEQILVSQIGGIMPVQGQCSTSQGPVTIPFFIGTPESLRVVSSFSMKS